MFSVRRANVGSQRPDTALNRPRVIDAGGLCPTAEYHCGVQTRPKQKKKTVKLRRSISIIPA